MATKIESTVGNAAADLARARLPGRRRVAMIVHDEQDEAALADPDAVAACIAQDNPARALTFVAEI